MENVCSKCGKKINESRKKLCDDCRKQRAETYYAYSELRFEVWQFLRNHGPEMTRKMIFNEMVNEEGIDWVTDALGEELIKAINENVR